MDKQPYIELLETQLRSLFLLIRNRRRPAEADRRYAEGLVHAAQALQVMTAAEIQEVMEKINFEVFGMNIVERQKRYPTDRMAVGSVMDMPTFQRKGINVE